MKVISRTLGVAAPVAAILLQAAAHGGSATCYNEDAVFNGTGQATTFDIIMRGHRTFTDFQNPVFGFNGPGEGASSTYDSGTDTTDLHFFGAAINPGTSLHFGYSLVDGTPNQHGFGPPDILSQGYNLNLAGQQSVASGFAHSVDLSSPVIGPACYLVLFSQAQPVGGGLGDRVGEWTATRIPAGQAPQATFANQSAGNLQIFNARFMCLTPADVGLAEDDPGFAGALLNMLNQAHLPLSDPRFEQVAGINDGDILAPGATEFAMIPVPEVAPAAQVALASAGLAGFAFWRRRRAA